MFKDGVLAFGRAAGVSPTLTREAIVAKEEADWDILSDRQSYFTREFRQPIHFPQAFFKSVLVTEWSDFFYE